jgi:hypothetical protein
MDFIMGLIFDVVRVINFVGSALNGDDSVGAPQTNKR